MMLRDSGLLFWGHPVHIPCVEFTRSSAQA